MLVTLHYTDLAVAGLLLLVNGGLSMALELGLARPLLVAALRMVVQLSLVGLVLTRLFALESPWLTLGAALVMLLFAGQETMARQERRLAGWWSYGIGTGAMGAAAAIVLLLGLTTAVQVAAEVVARRATTHGGDHAATHDHGAQIASLALRDEALDEDVLLGSL